LKHGKKQKEQENGACYVLAEMVLGLEETQKGLPPGTIDLEHVSKPNCNALAQV